PSNPEALAGLDAAQKARGEAEAQARKKREEDERQTAFRILLDAGKANLAAERFDAAVLALGEALKIRPGDEDALAGLAAAQKGRAAAKGALAEDEMKRKGEEYRKLMAAGRQSLFVTRQYDRAVAAFTAAQELFPGDLASARFLDQAEKALASVGRQQNEDQQRATEVQKLLAAGREALAARDLFNAGRAFQAATQLAPADVTVFQA